MPNLKRTFWSAETPQKYSVSWPIPPQPFLVGCGLLVKIVVLVVFLVVVDGEEVVLVFVVVVCFTFKSDLLNRH